MNCCNPQNNNQKPADNQTSAIIPKISLSQWIMGFAAAIGLIYLFVKVL